MKDTDIFGKIAETLMIDYTSVYYVDAVTNEYRWYSVDPEFRSLHIAQEGKDFFRNMKTDAEKVVYEEDRHIFTEDMQKDKLLAAMKNGSMQSIQYRLMIDGKPVYHSLRVIRGAGGDSGDDYFILGVLNIDREVRIKEQAESMRRESEIYNRIALTLADNFDTIFYIDADTGKFFEYTSSEKYKSMKVPTEGRDFFAETRENVKRYAHPDDWKFAESLYYKDVMLANLEGRKSFSYTYRLIVGGETRDFRFNVFCVNDRKNLVVCLRDITDELEAERALRAKQKLSVTYGQIAESLAAKYDIIYYIDIADAHYAAFSSNPIYGQLEVHEEGNDFFTETKRNTLVLVHPEDRDKLIECLGRDYMISKLEDKKQYTLDYRLMIKGKPKYTRCTVMWSSDKAHIILGVENVDEEVRKEKEHIKALNTEKELARRDELTGTRNKTAYTELERSVQSNIENGMDYLPFALVVCDVNGLKQVNDNRGHKAGDDYIRTASKLICDVFAHSPVFRIGGDEFVVFLRGGDYPKRNKLFEELCSRVSENLKKPDAPVIAAGMAEYDPERDKTMSEVFERADNMMYENKRMLKHDN